MSSVCEELEEMLAAIEGNSNTQSDNSGVPTTQLELFLDQLASYSLSDFMNWDQKPRLMVENAYRIPLI
jgi:hypothetical protein